MRRYRPFLLLGLAAVIAFSTASVAYRWLAAQSRESQPRAEEATASVDVTVAAFDIARGATISLEMLKTAKIPQQVLPAGSFKAEEINSLVGRVAVVDVVANETILQAKLAPLDATRGVAALIDPAKRAMAVKVSPEVGVAGFIKPNDRVDVFVTIEASMSGSGSSGESEETDDKTESVSKLVLANALVLAIGTELVRQGKDEVASPVTVLTLEVTPPEAEKLALASTRGEFRLALRSPLTKEDPLTPGATVDSLLSSYQGGDDGKRRKKGSDGVGVQLIKGKVVTFVPF